MRIARNVRNVFENYWFAADKKSFNYGIFQNLVEFAIRANGGRVEDDNGYKIYHISDNNINLINFIISDSDELYHFFKTHK
jgi:hypothetical protein